MSAMGRCGHCGATFAGRQNHCTLCHETFASETAGDAHRVGPYDPPARRCLTPDEMTAKGLWIDDRGIWHGRATTSGVPARRASWKGATS